MFLSIEVFLLYYNNKVKVNKHLVVSNDIGMTLFFEVMLFYKTELLQK